MLTDEDLRRLQQALAKVIDEFRRAHPATRRDDVLVAIRLLVADIVANSVTAPSQRQPG